MNFVPLHKRMIESSKLPSFISQLAHFKNAFRKSSGHINAGDVSYIRIPKAANTSMSLSLLKKIYPALAYKSINEKQINFLTDVNLSQEANESTYFTVVRNPLARLVSVYRSFFENNSPEYIYESFLFGILPQQLSFVEFVDRISRIPDALKDPHFKPQSCFLNYYDELKIPVKIFKIEEPEELKGFLEKHNLELHHLNRSTEKYNYENYFDEKTRAQAKEIYAVDIRKFNYLTEFDRPA